MPLLSLPPPFSLWPSRFFVFLPFPPKPPPLYMLSSLPGPPLSGAQVELRRRLLPYSQPSPPPPCGSPLLGWPLHAALTPGSRPSRPAAPRPTCSAGNTAAPADLPSRPVRRCRPFSSPSRYISKPVWLLHRGGSLLLRLNKRRCAASAALQGKFRQGERWFTLSLANSNLHFVIEAASTAGLAVLPNRPNSPGDKQDQFYALELQSRIPCWLGNNGRCRLNAFGAGEVGRYFALAAFRLWWY